MRSKDAENRVFNSSFRRPVPPFRLRFQIVIRRIDVIKKMVRIGEILLTLPELHDG